MIDQRILQEVKSKITEDNEVWKLSDEMAYCYNNIEKSRFYDSSGICPETLKDVENNIYKFFPIHYPKVQHTLYSCFNIFLEKCLQNGSITVMDIGCGPGTSSLALLDYITQIISSYENLGISYPYAKPFHFRFILNDINPYCLLKSMNFLTEYFQHICKKFSYMNKYLDFVPNIFAINTPFSQVIPEYKKIIGFAGKVNLVLCSNVIYQLFSEEIKNCNNACIPCIPNKSCRGNFYNKIRNDFLKLKDVVDETHHNIMLLQEDNTSNMLANILLNTINLARITQKNYDQNGHNFRLSFPNRYGRAVRILT